MYIIFNNKSGKYVKGETALDGHTAKLTGSFGVRTTYTKNRGEARIFKSDSDAFDYAYGKRNLDIVPLVESRES